ncbi:unnamed protein product [Ostreobium quekettii]|uniref:Nuclear segregation protein n=1 Tax=Ostreobium quekettii TaxID=121088 RepID=A0A8S1IY06_9CHLO|nr:unnamed protein product [Ostreobium quekettii]|eukprot:evm.model.scf_11.19 EVM.evm.TU.scf_11.19   scf_11:191735-195282(+)
MALSEDPEAPTAEGGPPAGKAPPAMRMKRPTAPDRAEMDKQIEKLNAETERHAGRIREIKDLLQARRDRSKGTGGEEAAVMRRLADFRAQFEATKNQKQAWQDELARAEQTREALRAQVKALKGRVKYATVEDIDGQIGRLEAELNGSGLSPGEEERKVRQIKDLAQSRATVKNYHDRLEKMQEDDRMREGLARRVAGAEERLEGLRGDIAREKGRMAELHACRDDDSTEESSLREEKEECWAIMQALRAKRDAIRDEYREKYEEFKRREAEFRKWQSEDRKKRQEARKKDYEQRQAERAAERAEYEVDVYEEKLLQCDQMLSYLSKFSNPSKEEAAKEAAKEVEAPAPGMKLLNRDDDPDLGWFSGMGSKANAKKQKGKKAMKENRFTEEKKLMHTIDILQAFHRLQVPVPNTVSEVCKTIELVKDKKEQLRDRKEKGLAPTEALPKAESSKGSSSKPVSNGKAAGESSDASPGGLNEDEYPALVGKKDTVGQEQRNEPEADGQGLTPADGADPDEEAAEEPEGGEDAPATGKEAAAAPECDSKEAVETPAEPAEAAQCGHSETVAKEPQTESLTKREEGAEGLTEEKHCSPDATRDVTVDGQ